MRAMLVGLILCPVSVFGQQGDRKSTTIDSLEQFGEFSQTYYAEPRPDLIPAALRFLDASPLVSNPSRVPLVAMSLSCILHRPELKSRSWDTELLALRESTRRVVQAALSTEPDALLAQVAISPQMNDMNWACWFGSGQEKYLDNLVAALGNWVSEKICVVTP